MQLSHDPDQPWFATYLSRWRHEPHEAVGLMRAWMHGGQNLKVECHLASK